MRSELPKRATLMDTAEEDVPAWMTFPARHRAKLHAANPIERPNGEIKRTPMPSGFGHALGSLAFVPPIPNGASIRRLVGAIVMEQPKEWAVRPGRYLALETFALVCDDAMTSLPAVQRDRPTRPAPERKTHRQLHHRLGQHPLLAAGQILAATSPSHVAKSRSDRNCFGGGTKRRMARDVTVPAPGMVRPGSVWPPR